MRWLLALLPTVTAVHAEPLRECHLQDAEVARTVKQLGCFDDIKSTEDHTYGYRVCLLRARNGVCSGVLWEWRGDPEGKAMVLENAFCGSKDGPVTFAAVRLVALSPLGIAKGGPRRYPRTFTGKLSKRALRGKFRENDQVRNVTWALTKDGFDPIERIRRDTQAACGSPTSP